MGFRLRIFKPSGKRNISPFYSIIRIRIKKKGENSYKPLSIFVHYVVEDYEN